MLIYRRSGVWKKEAQKSGFPIENLVILLKISTKTERYSEIQLKEALLNKEKDTSSSRQNFEEKSQNIPFIHETSIVNHKCENIHSNEMENLNMVGFFQFNRKKLIT